MSCCLNILKLKDVNICGGVIDTGMVAGITGKYSLQLDYLGGVITIEHLFSAGSPLVFNPAKLNEEYYFEGKVLSPSGSPLSREVNGVIYNCLGFSTSPVAPVTTTSAPNPDDPNPTPGSDSTVYTCQAGETLSGGRVVIIDGGKAFYFQPSNVAFYGRAFGVTTNAAIINTEVTVKMLGIMDWPDNNLTPGAVYFSGANGALTTNPTGLTIVQRIGHAIATNKLKLSFDLNIVTI